MSLWTGNQQKSDCLRGLRYLIRTNKQSKARKNSKRVSIPRDKARKKGSAMPGNKTNRMIRGKFKSIANVDR